MISLPDPVLFLPESEQRGKGKADRRKEEIQEMPKEGRK
jgi:hypothetical protein